MSVRLPRRISSSPTRSCVMPRGEFCEWVTSLPNIPTIVSMRQQANRIRNEELERLLTQLGPLTEQQRERLVAFSHRLINKVLHFPTVVMKQGNLR